MGVGVPGALQKFTQWLTEDETRTASLRLIDVLYALWGLWPGHTDKSPWPPGAPTLGERDVEFRGATLHEFPVGTRVGRQFIDARGRERVFRGTVCNFSDPLRRVSYQDGDWEEFTRRETWFVESP